MSGKGKYIWADNRRYTGEWKDDCMDGQGEFEWLDGRMGGSTWVGMLGISLRGGEFTNFQMG